MLQFIATNAVISRGFDNKAALKFSDDGNIVRFRIGERVYDKNAENNTRWINLNVKAFGNLCERIKKMQLKEGSFVNLIGRFDEDVWTDRETGEARSQPVIYLSDIEFAGSRSKGEQKSDSRGGFGDGVGSYGNDPAPSPAPAGQNFQGYGSFDGGSSFFSD